uniref:RING-type domain-containing protein n=1 Tax=Araucaria cunninghamii TaxID=56994 RepID=A0A0D6R3W6_ARACU
MGLSSFPSTVSEGVLPILIVNTALSFAIIKDILRSILQIVGLTPHTEPEFIDPSWPYPNENTNALNTPADMASSGPHNPEVHLIAEEIRQSLPVKRFQFDGPASNEDDDDGHVECAVCLCKFEEGVEIRQLPCCHFFHRPCLDKWLDHQQTTCPLCRSCLITQDMRLREHELTDELLFWYSSFQEAGYHGMWIER